MSSPKDGALRDGRISQASVTRACPRARLAILTVGLVTAGLEACLVRVAEPTDASASDAATDSRSPESATDSITSEATVDARSSEAAPNPFADVPRAIDASAPEIATVDAFEDIAPPDTRVSDVVVGDAGESVSNPSSLAMGGGFGCACDRGIVRCWGTLWNSTDVSLPTTVPGLTDAVGIAAGAVHVCAVRSAGGVTCWGGNHDGQLGDGAYSDHSEPRDVIGIADAVAVAAGETSTCSLLSTGHVQCWGSNTRGELGNGATVSSAVPVDVSGISDATALTFSGSRGCVIRSDGSLWCWGANDNSEIGDGTTTDRTTPTRVSLPDAVRVVTTTRTSTIAVLRSGATWCWGSGYCGDADPRPRPTPVPIDTISSVSFLGVAEGYTLCFADGADNPFCAGPYVGASLEYSATPLAIMLPERPAAFATTGRSACAQGESGHAYCWGLNVSGEIGDGTRTANGTPTLVTW